MMSVNYLLTFRNQFKHKRMASDNDGVNVEISNPIYMRDYEEDEVVDEFGLDNDKVGFSSSSVIKRENVKWLSSLYLSDLLLL